MTAPLEETIEDLARAFAASRTPQDRERLCEAALPMVRRLATAVLRRLPAHFVADDLVGDGCLGLLRAVDRFDPSHGIAFEIWAARIVRGAMLNGLRRMDVIPERVRRDARNLDQARWQLAQHGGESPSDAAAAAGAGLSERKLNAVLLALRRAVPLSLDAPVGISEQGAALGERIESETADPAQIVAQRSVDAVLARAVTTLSARERLIIASFYAGETTFRAIGGRLGISKQRVSQIHGRAIASLRAMLALAAVDA
jgi:RNA polymerase sigma factor for flagellar operon FliA